MSGRGFYAYSVSDFNEKLSEIIVSFFEEMEKCE
jgi:hypothetical protein